MLISINGKPVDITLDTEKTLGDVLSGIEQWISPSRSRIQKLNLNGNDICENTLSSEFGREIGDIKELEIFVSSWCELAAEALMNLLETCAIYEKAPFAERQQIISHWEGLAAARFLASDIPDIYNLSRQFFSGEGLSSSDFVILIEERLRETQDPRLEIENCEDFVKSIAQRMEELPLDMQTGKDLRAAETIQLFSRTCEKLFRFFFISKLEGLVMESFLIDEIPVISFLEEFNSALNELSSAYEKQDTVVTGDIAEYELAPRVIKFHTALKNLFK